MSYQYVFSNNAASTLSGGITNTATSLSLQTGAGALFPNPNTGLSPPQAFAIELVSQSNPTTREIMLCTSRSADTLTVIRGQEGTSALSWNAGDIVQHGPTAAQMNAMQQIATAGGSGPITPVFKNYIYPGNDSGIADSYVVTVNSGLNSYIDGCVIEFAPANTNLTQTPVINVNSIGSRSIYRIDGTSIQPGDLGAGLKLLFSYNSGLGGFVALNLPNASVVSYSFADPGYILYSNGLCYQWGQMSFPPGTNSFDIVLPRAFTTGFLGAATTDTGNQTFAYSCTFSASHPKTRITVSAPVYWIDPGSGSIVTRPSAAGYWTAWGV